VRADNVLLLPITYDDSLSAQIESGEQIETMDVGGFLAVSSGNGFNANRLSIRLNPDQIMFARVSVSYLNLLTFLTLVVALEVRRRSLLHSNRRDLIRGREEIR
jgi:hypothetical protein